MAIKEYKPTTAGRRGASVVKNDFVTTARPEKSLTLGLSNKSGRAKGKISTRHKGGGAKRLYRIIDFGQDKVNIPARVASIEYDPNRSAYIALLNYKDGEKRYILAPEGLRANDEVIVSSNAPVEKGNRLILKNIPVGTSIHNVEMSMGRGGQIARTAGAYATLMAKESEYALLKMPSGELRKIHINCRATIGQLGNVERANIKVGKAGRNRWLGWRPHVRGTVMNPIDHPHGGGEGKTKGGRNPVTPWGQPTKGYKTRRNKRTTKFIVKRRG